jgi:hypothetical protein
MRLALSLALFIPGVLLLATPGIALGLLLILAGCWVYDRSGLRSDEGFIAFMIILGAIGAGMVIVQFIWQAIGRALQG